MIIDVHLVAKRHPTRAFTVEFHPVSGAYESLAELPVPDSPIADEEVPVL
jgi:hypothetical protein